VSQTPFGRTAGMIGLCRGFFSLCLHVPTNRHAVQ
jgi:hypothetical protein